MKKLCESALAIGDIILTTSNALDSKVIRVYTKSDISHAMIYVDNYSVIDSTNEGVHARNTQRLFFEDDCQVHVLRLKSQISQADIQKLCNFIRSCIGTEYSKREALITGLGGSKSSTKKQFCSRLVAMAYEVIGQQLVSDPKYCSPQNLKDSQLLIEVREVTQFVSDQEIEMWENTLDLPQLMRDAIVKVLQEARKKSKDIQDLNDLDNYLIIHPEDDTYFCNVLKDSDYLTLWKKEVDQNPWQYDITLMRSWSINEDEKEKYCKNVISSFTNAGQRYHLNKAGYLKLWWDHKLETFQVLADLYEKLSDLDVQRFHVAKQWLDEYTGKIPPNPFLVPHSSEWFAALEEQNPYQATQTRIIVELAGKLDVCSICGDHPASDYKMDEEIPTPGSVATLRLCADCLEIRKMKGESFVPVNP